MHPILTAPSRMHSHRSVRFFQFSGMARAYNPVMKPVDRIGFRDWRAWATHVQGRVLEIGAGTGLNFPHYPSTASVFAFEPDHHKVVEMDRRSSACFLSVTRARAEELPFPSDSFDAAVGTLVMCTIPDPGRALVEVRRVLKPGGALRLVEHVRAPNPIVGSVMDLLTPLWTHLADGCHLNRDTLAAVRAAGFEIVTVKKKWGGLVIGIDARKPEE